MKMDKKPLALPTVCNMQERIDTNPDYQRPPAWSKKQKQLLMDTILRNYDIPKFYWREVNRADGVKYEVIDGQQRLRAIWEFYKGEYSLAKDAEPIDDHNVAGHLFSELPLEINDVFNTYSLDVAIVTDGREADIRDMFRRLQNGTPLKSQEKRNAMTGNMRDFVKDIASHPFFENCKFSNKRLTFDHIAAQTILLELAGEPTNVKDADLNRMYKDHLEFNKNGDKASKVKKVYDFLEKAFPKQTQELERYSVITLYCMASVLIDNYVWKDLAEPLAKWFIDFETERRKNKETEQDVSLVEYRRLTSQSTDSKESIASRLKTLEERFFLAHPDIEKRDSVRSFNEEQRLAIYRRDKGRCQLCIKCDGKEELDWNDWHADHKKSHSDGGETTVSNGQVACPACNLSKGNKSS